MEITTPRPDDRNSFPPARIDAFGRLMVSIAELVTLANQYADNHAALVAIEPDQDRRRAA